MRPAFDASVSLLEIQVPPHGMCNGFIVYYALVLQEHLKFLITPFDAACGHTGPTSGPACAGNFIRPGESSYMRISADG